jgi:L,D-transpeptidase ErfK/SrfK
MTTKNGILSRRRFGALIGGAALAATAGPALAAPEQIERRISGLHSIDWREHFDSVENDAILCNLADRVLHYWGADGFYRIYPTSVPLSDELTRRGRTAIILKRPAPDWRPTPSMIERNPDLPRYVGAGPENPLGVRALNLGWPYYLIHGTNDIRKIGRQSSSGCVGLFNEHILEVYDRAKLGTPVFLI